MSSPSAKKRRQMDERQRIVIERHRQVDERRREVEERRRGVEERGRATQSHRMFLLKLQQNCTEKKVQLMTLKQEQAVETHISALECDIAELTKIIEEEMDRLALMKEEDAKLDSNAEAEIGLINLEISELNEQIACMELAADTSAGYDYFDHVVKLGAPSSLSRAENWRRAQEKLVFLCHIPPDAEPPFPLTLAHRAFANFADRFHTSRIEFGNEECELVVELCYLVARDFKDEKAKMEAFNELIGNYLGEAVKQVVVRSSFTTDGTVLCSEHMVYLEEGKKEEGNPLFQAMQYYALFLSKMKRGKTKSTFCPCFLVELVGVQIRISGLAYFSKVACQPFTPFMHCYINTYDKADMDSLCRAMLALKKGVCELKEYYNNPHPNPPPTVDKRLPYPLQEQQVRYVQRIGAEKLLFVVEMEQSGDRRLFKYCKRYGRGVHEIWAQAGLAPKLFECREIPGGWFAVEMEYLSADDWKSVHQWFDQLPESDQSRLWLEVDRALQRALSLKCEMEYLSAHDWNSVQQLCSSVSKRDESALLLAVENAVKSVLKLKHEVAHGDMRPPNVMARLVEGEFEIKFVDFDWAGVVSYTSYPSFINTQQEWHADVGPGVPLSQDHDKWWWIQHKVSV